MHDSLVGIIVTITETYYSNNFILENVLAICYTIYAHITLYIGPLFRKRTSITVPFHTCLKFQNHTCFLHVVVEVY